MKTFRKIIQLLNTLGRWVSGVMLLLMTFVLFLNVVARNFLGSSYVGTEALGIYAMVWLTFIGSAFIVYNHGHVAVDLLLRAVGTRPMRYVVAFTAIIGMLTSAIMTWLGIELTRFIFASGQIETTLGVSSGYMYLPIGIGMALMFLNYTELLISMILKDDSRLPSMEELIEAGLTTEDQLEA